MTEPIRVRLHYDFASTLCYVAHRVLDRMADALDGLGIELSWTPLDLTRLVALQRPGAPIDELRRSNAARVAEELGVPVRVPRVWPEARALGAVALQLRTAAAREELVTGVPTFMLGSWPFGGIQSEDTLLRVLERFAKKARS